MCKNLKGMKKYIVLILALFVIVNKTYAQDKSIEDLLNLRLPPLDSLFEGARRSPMIEFYEYRNEIQELELKTERRNWLQYFSIGATYQYGIVGMNTFTELGANYPVVYQSSGGNQIWYNAAASFRLPLENLFDRRNRIKIQQLKIKETLKEKELWYDDQKSKIVQYYFRAQEILNNLKLFIEVATMANAQYEAAQKDFIMGSISLQALSVAKNAQVLSLTQLEQYKSTLTSSIVQLEIISNTKILNR